MNMNETDTAVEAGMTGDELGVNENLSGEETAADASVDTGATGSEGDGAAAAEPQLPDYVAAHWPIKFRGRTILPETREQLINWAQLGYHNDKRMASLKERETKLSELEKGLEQYKAMQEMFEEVPDFKSGVLDLYNRLKSGAGAPPAAAGADGMSDAAAAAAGGQELPPQVAQYISKLEGTIQKMGERLDGVESRYGDFEKSQATREVDQEIETLKKAHPDEAWGVPDEESGKTLERELLEYARDHNLDSLEAAYKVVMWDSTMARVKSDALKAAAENKQKGADASAVGRGGANAAGMGASAVNPRNKTYDQLMADAMGELSG